MGKKITWWHRRCASDIHENTIVIMRYDWPDKQRIYQIGIYLPGNFFPWQDGKGGVLQVPDYFIVADQVVAFIKIPAEEEYTFGPEKP